MLEVMSTNVYTGDHPRTLGRSRYTHANKLKTAITAFISNISQADLQKVFAGSDLYGCSWTSLPTTFVSALRASERTVYEHYICEAKKHSHYSDYATYWNAEKTSKPLDQCRGQKQPSI
jgi:hypothetical protein